MSIKAIQETTGFSCATISRVINGKAKEYRISKKTAQKILAAAKRLNYRPSIVAQSLRLKRTKTIGLILSDIQNPFFGELGSIIEKELRAHGYSTILCNAGEVPEHEQFYLKILTDRKVDGIIIAPIHTREWKDLEVLGESLPIVLVDRIFFQTKIPWVTSENIRAAQAITEKMIGLGHKNIAFLGGKKDSYINHVRFEGYSNAFEKNGLKLNPRLIFSRGYSVKDGVEMMAAALREDRRIQAVFCVNNLVFLGAMKIIQKNEMEGGPHVLLGAFDIGSYVDIFKRPLICANQDTKTMGKTVVHVVLSLIQNRPCDQWQTVVPTPVEAHRTSVDPYIADE